MEHWSVCTEVHFKNARWELAVRGALTEVRDGKRLFALPYSVSGPFPLPELMCFARLISLNGRKHIMYAFDEEQRPTF